MTKRLLIALGLLLAVASSVSAQDIKYNFDKEANFAAFKTYKWVPIKGAQPLNAIVDKQIIAAIDVEMAKKGLAKTEADTADLYIGYQAAVESEKQFTSYTSGWGTGPGWYGAGWYGGGGLQTTTGQTTTIYVGQLALDMYSTASKSLVWRGTATKTLDTKAKPDKQEKNLAKAMEKLFKNFPPPVKKK